MDSEFADKLHPHSEFIVDGWDGFNPQDHLRGGKTDKSFTQWACSLRPQAEPDLCLILINVPSCMKTLFSQTEYVCEHIIAINMAYYHLHELTHWAQEPEEFFRQAEAEGDGSDEYPDWSDVLNSIVWNFGCVET